MAAVYAEDLKKPLSKTLKKSIRPKARPVSERKMVASVAKPGKVTGSGRGDGKKELLSRQSDPKSPSRLKGAAWMKKNTWEDYMALTKSEARALGLPATRIAATQHRLRNYTFKDGRNFMGK